MGGRSSPSERWDSRGLMHCGGIVVAVDMELLGVAQGCVAIRCLQAVVFAC